MSDIVFNCSTRVASIPAGKRKALLPKIETEMMRLAKQGYVYNGDTRWSHVGLRLDCDGNEKIVFVDMESLEEVKTEMPLREQK